MQQSENGIEVTVELPNKSVIALDLLDIANDGTEWQPYYNFMAKPVPFEILFKDRFLQWLDSEYGYKAGVLKMEPFTQYDWHIDDRRGVGVNLLLSFEGTSVCMFTNTPSHTVKKVYPFGYTPDTYIIFNTQIPHCVINFDKPRYLFSIEFDKGKDELSFDDLVNDIRDNYKGRSNE